MGDALRLQREAHGLSQQQLALQLAVTRQAVSKWERDLSYPDADMLVRLAAILDCDVRVLLGIRQQHDWLGWLRLRLQSIEEVMTMPENKHRNEDVRAVAKQYIKELDGLLRQRPDQTPPMQDITDVLGQVYLKLDKAKNPEALVNRMVNFVRIKASVGKIHFAKPQESLLIELAWIGAKAGLNGQYMADFSDKRQFYSLLEPMPRR